MSDKILRPKTIELLEHSGDYFEVKTWAEHGDKYISFNEGQFTNINDARTEAINLVSNAILEGEKQVWFIKNKTNG